MKVAILGEGVTGTAVKESCERLNIDLVSPEKADLVVASPGIPESAYPAVDAPIISEIEFTYQECLKRLERPFLIGVTGTNGKSTVTALIAHILDCPALGNIGDPFVSLLGKMPSRVVIELSSYQLARCYDFHADISVLLNLTPDHLERHGSLEAYARAKAQLIQNNVEKDKVIFNGEDEAIAAMVQDCPSECIDFVNFAKEQGFKEDVLFGAHNQENMAAAYLVARSCGMSHDQIMEKISCFKGLPHRLQKIGEYEDRHWFNDSKSTNPDSSIKAVKSFEGAVHLILCGKDKGLDWQPFYQALLEGVRSVVLFGDLAGRLSEEIKQVSPTTPISVRTSVDQAIEKAYENSDPHDVILFSPGSASFDQFSNFEHRGDVFTETVHKRFKAS